MGNRAPVFFVGHGSPMNAIAENSFTQALKRLGSLYPNPKAILCISAHWMTEGTWVTAMEKPKTIHDFYGFPPELFAVQYPAPGSPKLAEEISKLFSAPHLNLDKEIWGFDHGTWSVLRHMYPAANIPVLQLSLHMEQPAAYHYELGKELRALRDQGILIVGSGNIVHNLSKIRWGDEAEPYSWALKFDAWMKEQLEARNDNAIVSEYLDSEAGKLSVPTNEHYFPLLYSLGAAGENEMPKTEYEEIQNGSISMRTISFGA
ncbi:MAG: 4,5-DOPA-extradiol-dioxygenase [Bdellovibrionota bacterium]